MQYCFNKNTNATVDLPSLNVSLTQWLNAKATDTQWIYVPEAYDKNIN